MLRSILYLVSGLLLAINVVEPAAAELEELAPETAHEELSQTEGVVLVDLFAHW